MGPWPVKACTLTREYFQLQVDWSRARARFEQEITEETEEGSCVPIRHHPAPSPFPLLPPVQSVLRSRSDLSLFIHCAAEIASLRRTPRGRWGQPSRLLRPTFRWLRFRDSPARPLARW